MSTKSTELYPFLKDITIYLYYKDAKTQLKNYCDDVEQSDNIDNFMFDNTIYSANPKLVEYLENRINNIGLNLEFPIINYSRKLFAHINENLSKNQFLSHEVKIEKNKLDIKNMYRWEKMPNINSNIKETLFNIKGSDKIYNTLHVRQKHIWKTYFWSSKKPFKSIVDRMKNKIIHSFRFAEVPEKFITVKQEKYFKTIPWSKDMKPVIDSIRDGNKEIWEITTETKKTYLRVKDIKERMLRIPLLGNPTNCRLNPTYLDEKKIHTFCCLLMLSVSYSVPMIRAVNWEIVNKTWMMMLHQYKNIINEDGFWLVDIPEETKKKLDAIKKVQDESIDEDMEEEDLQVTFHGGRLLELVVRIYNLRITQDDDKGLKLFKPGVNNYRTYLEKYFEKMQPFMTPLEVQDGDNIADVIIKESWVHPKSLIDDVVEPFCKNMSVLLGFGDNPKIVYNDYFD